MEMVGHRVSGSIAPITSDVSYSLTGKNVDLIIQDSGILQYHPEFMKADGTSSVKMLFLMDLYTLILILYLQANTYTKADGRTGISTTALLQTWWVDNSTTYRSSSFASGGADDFGTITIASSYTVPNALGDSLDGTNTINASHGKVVPHLPVVRQWVLLLKQIFGIYLFLVMLISTPNLHMML